MGDSELQAMINDVETMSRLIGRRVRYQMADYEVTDILPDEGLIILSADEGSDVQDDSYGRPHRLVPKRHNLHFRDAEGHPTSIWEDMAFLDGPLMK